MGVASPPYRRKICMYFGGGDGEKSGPASERLSLGACRLFFFIVLLPPDFFFFFFPYPCYYIEVKKKHLSCSMSDFFFVFCFGASGYMNGQRRCSPGP